jgi:hypothetical protein
MRVKAKETGKIVCEKSTSLEELQENIKLRGLSPQAKYTD